MRDYTRILCAVMHAAGCAVRCVPAPAADTVDPWLAGLRRIVCLVSFSEPSRLALALAGELAAQAAAHLAVTHREIVGGGGLGLRLRRVPRGARAGVPAAHDADFGHAR